jgi:hypothetical protein
MVGLLDVCVKNLQAQGMRRMFLDGVAQGLDELRLVGKCNYLQRYFKLTRL